MKRLLLAFLVLMMVSVDVQGHPGGCLTGCKTIEVQCRHTDRLCDSPLNCINACVAPFVQCARNCGKKREILSRFFRDSNEEE